MQSAIAIESILLSANAAVPCRTSRRNPDCPCRRVPRRRRTRRTQTPRAFWSMPPNRNAGISSPSSRWNAPAPRCPFRTSRNEIRKSAWEQDTTRPPDLKPVTAQTLNLNNITSPSFTAYSLPSMRYNPFSRAAATEPHFTRSSYATVSALMNPRSKSL